MVLLADIFDFEEHRYQTEIERFKKWAIQEITEGRPVIVEIKKRQSLWQLIKSLLGRKK